MKYLFCSLDSPGFLFPAIGIARALEKCGHDVSFVADSSAARLLDQVGIKRIPRGRIDGPSFRVAEWPKPFAVAIQVKHIEYALERFEADALVGQSLTLGPLLAAERSGLPVGVVGFATYLWPRSDASSGNQSELQARLVWRHGDMIGWLNRARELFRMPIYEGSCRSSPLLGDLLLVRSVPELEPAPETLPDRVHLVGSCLWEPANADADLEEWLAEAEASGRPIVYVQQGRSFNVPSFWPYLVTALRGESCKVVASVDKMTCDQGEIPNNFFVRDHIPQCKVMQFAHVLVSSANTTSFLGALTAGIPALFVPAGGEQHELAHLAESAGVGSVLSPYELSPEVIRDEMEGLLAVPSFREKAQVFKAAFARMGGFDRVIDLLERMAAGQSIMRSVRG